MSRTLTHKDSTIKDVMLGVYVKPTFRDRVILAARLLGKSNKDVVLEGLELWFAKNKAQIQEARKGSTLEAAFKALQ